MKVDYSTNSSSRALFLKVDCQKVAIWFSKKIPVALYNKETERLFMVNDCINSYETLKLKKVKEELKVPLEKIKWININHMMNKVQKI